MDRPDSDAHTRYLFFPSIGDHGDLGRFSLFCSCQFAQ
jgi:hypothetical protein